MQDVIMCVVLHDFLINILCSAIYVPFIVSYIWFCYPVCSEYSLIQLYIVSTQ